MFRTGSMCSTIVTVHLNVTICFNCYLSYLSFLFVKSLMIFPNHVSSHLTNSSDIKDDGMFNIVTWLVGDTSGKTRNFKTNIYLS